jgi:hypothetical protein
LAISTARSYGWRSSAAAAHLPYSAYVLARRWLDTGGTDGLPAVQIGRSIRIPTVALERLAEPDPAPSAAALRLIDAG